MGYDSVHEIFLGKFLGVKRGLWFTLDVSQISLGIFRIKKTHMPFSKNFSGEFFLVKKRLFIYWVFL
jgi:hypothetical protein